MNKYRVKTGAALALALTLLLAGCSASNSDSGSTAAQAPTDGVLNIAMLGDLSDPPDPDVSYGDGLNIVNNVYEGLVRYSKGSSDLTVEPWLATSWTNSADFKTWTFKLRDDVTFHDGTKFDSSAVAPAIERRTKLGNGMAYTVADVAKVDTPDATTAVITLKEPNSSFLNIMASPFGIRFASPTGLTKNAGTDDAQTYLRTHDLGSGPYELTSVEAAVGYKMDYADSWWGTKPTFTTINYKVLNDASSMQLQYDNGEIDIILQGLTGAAFADYKTRKSSTTYSLPILQVEMMRLNPKSGPFTDPAFMQAFRNAIDSKTLATQLWNGAVTPATTIYGQNFLPEADSKQNVSYDPSELETMIKALPADQKTITIAYRAASDLDAQLVNIVAAQMQGYGLTVKIFASPSGVEYDWASDLESAPGVFFAATYPDGQDPYLWAQLYWPTTAPLNTFACTDPFIDKNLPIALSTGDEDLYAQIGQKADEMGCWTNLEYLSDFMVAPTWMTGVKESHDFTAPGYLDFTTLGTKA
ncbi:ABC transporter substrate-binding protein [Glaciihabitans sp. dw_435]|uniref:ABC transporter substrate-binding protein n=1 Tax=Glaciihabitans sp. dw_435 TaxID=2720081 RepID=UPI001BD6AB6F|nr:ABC transporter substrate-binding protein [Glaciihabitans sp. dw_435]